MTTTATEAHAAILEHHRQLGEQLGAHVAALSESVAAHRPHEADLAGLVAYLAEQVLPHAAAEEKTIYPAAAAHAGLADVVSGMTAEHQVLATSAERLAGTADGASAAEQAGQIAALFEAHVTKENEVILPALVADGTTDLSALLAQMHHEMEQEGPVDLQLDGVPATDPLAAVLSLLVEGTTALARAGQAELACRIAASAWAQVRSSRPELAVRMTAVLHGLARRTNGGSWATVAKEQETGPAYADLDVRQLAPAQRHETIFDSYARLAPGTGIVLINDHDPKPLRYQFEAEHAGEFTWEPVESGPEVWRVRIGRVAANGSAPNGSAPNDSAPNGSAANGSAANGAAANGAAGAEEEPALDVRTIQHRQRHEVIFTAYSALAPGAGFILVNDHDPLPLRYQFESQFAGEHTWDYLEEGPRIWRVRIGRAAG